MKNIYLSILLFSSLFTFGANIYVNSSADSGPGSLRDAITSASNGDNVIITGGLEVKLEKEIEITKTITVKSSNNELATVNGQNKGRIFRLFRRDSISFISLRIINGKSNQSGGGISCSFTKINIENCLFENNSIINLSSSGFSSGGAGLNVYSNEKGVSCRIVNTIFKKNIINNYKNGEGGGLKIDFAFASSSSIQINNCVFSHNSIQGYSGNKGGAIYIQTKSYNTAIIANCSIDSNSIIPASGIAPNSFSYGGGAFLSNVRITNSTIFGNTAHSDRYLGYGGGLYIVNSVVTNCTITQNIAKTNSSDVYGGGIFAHGSSGIIINSIVYNNKEIDGSNTIENDFAGAVAGHQFYGMNIIGVGIENENVISINPLLESPIQFNESYIFPLNEASPAINTGALTVNNHPIPTIDQKGSPRVDSPDIGAYESDILVALSNKSNPDLTVYPNPSKGSFIINDNMSLNSDKIEIYNDNGDKIDFTFINNNISMENSPSGLYLLKYKRNNQSYTTKIIKR